MQINEILSISLQKTMFDMYRERLPHLFFKSRFPTLSFGTHQKKIYDPFAIFMEKKNLSPR